jgi:hypothetical protein
MQNEHDPGQAPLRGPQPGSPRVQSWIRTVLNPLIEAVEYELALLKRGSLTWRFYNRRPEHLTHVVAYVSDSRRALEDLLRARPKMAPPLKDHDRLLEVSVEQAGRAHDGILAKSEFLALVRTKLAEYEATHDPTRRPSGAFEPDKLPSLVAERIVNNDGASVGLRYTDAEFWNTNHDAFVAIGAGPDLEDLRSAVDAFRNQDVTLLSQLKDWHFELIEEFDVEPV